MQNASLCSSLHGPVLLMLSAALCVMLSSYAVMQFFVWVGEQKMPLRAGSSPVALPVCWAWALSVGCLGCPAPSEPLGLLLAGHPSGTGCFELVCSEAERLYSSVLYCTWLWAMTGSCMLLLWPQGMNFSLLSLWCSKLPTGLMF